MGFFSSIGKTLSKVGKTLTGAAKAIAPVVAGAGLGSSSLVVPSSEPQSILSTVGKVLTGAEKVGTALSETGCALGGCKSAPVPILAPGQGGIAPPATATAAPAALGFLELAAIGAGVWLLLGGLKK